jgi:hypothetical protein
MIWTDPVHCSRGGKGGCWFAKRAVGGAERGRAARAPRLGPSMGVGKKTHRRRLSARAVPVQEQQPRIQALVLFCHRHQRQASHRPEPAPSPPPPSPQRPRTVSEIAGGVPEPVGSPIVNGWSLNLMIGIETLTERAAPAGSFLPVGSEKPAQRGGSAFARGQARSECGATGTSIRRSAEAVCFHAGVEGAAGMHAAPALD